MKSFKISLPDEKCKFLIELMANLGFYCIELSPIPEPPSRQQIEKKQQEAGKQRQKSLMDVIERINKRRNK